MQTLVDMRCNFEKGDRFQAHQDCPTELAIEGVLNWFAGTANRGICVYPCMTSGQFCHLFCYNFCHCLQYFRILHLGLYKESVVPSVRSVAVFIPISLRVDGWVDFNCVWIAVTRICDLFLLWLFHTILSVWISQLLSFTFLLSWFSMVLRLRWLNDPFILVSCPFCVDTNLLCYCLANLYS